LHGDIVIEEIGRKPIIRQDAADLWPRPSPRHPADDRPSSGAHQPDPGDSSSARDAVRISQSSAANLRTTAEPDHAAMPGHEYPLAPEVERFRS